MAVMVGKSLSITNNAKPGCPVKCGNMTVPYPFGIGESCSLGPSYSLVCDESLDPPKAFTEKLNSSSTRFRVFEISETQMQVNGMIAYNCPPSNGTLDSIVSSKDVIFLPPSKSPFTLSNKGNFFSVAGSCDYIPTVTTPENYFENLTCRLSCYRKDPNVGFEVGLCSYNNGCCKRPFQNNVAEGFSLKVEYLTEVKVNSHTPCGYVFVGMEDRLTLRYVEDFSDPAYVSRTRDNVHMAIDWVIGNRTCDEVRGNPSTYACRQNTSCIDVMTGGYRCSCLHGYYGNPYVSPGCTDKNECASNLCFQTAVCNNTQGGFKCTCPKGYHGDGLKNVSGCKPKSISMRLLLTLVLD